VVVIAVATVAEIAVATAVDIAAIAVVTAVVTAVAIVVETVAEAVVGSPNHLELLTQLQTKRKKQLPSCFFYARNSVYSDPHIEVTRTLRRVFMPTNAPHSKPLSSANSDGAGCFLFAFFAALIGGAIGCYFFWQNYNEHQAFLTWPTVRAEISSNEIVRAPSSDSDTTPYKLQVTYSYYWEGKRYESSNVSKSGNAYSSYRRAVLDSDAIAKETLVRVNKDDLPSSVILADSAPSWWLLALPGFIALSGLYNVIRHLTTKRKTSRPTIETLQSGGRILTRVGVALLLLATGVGYAMLYPAVQHVSSQSWPEVPCKVLASSIVIHSGSDSSTYSTDVFYEYEYQGRSYRSNRLNFDTSSSSNRSYYQELLDAYPADSNSLAYVNPDDPTEAVLRRDHGSVLVLVLFAACLFFGMNAKQVVKAQNSAANGTTQKLSEFVNPKKSRVTGFIGILLFAIVWNGMVGFVGSLAYASSSKGALLFLSLFALAGLGLIVAVVNKFLAIFGPALLVKISTNPARIGAPLSIDWKTEGNKDKLESAIVTIEAEAKASYRRGTDTVTSTKKYLTLSQNLSSASLKQGFGTLRFDIPDKLMPTFVASNNSFNWNLSVALTVSRWPDSTDNYPLVMYPPK
jgi:hypothetical protein